MMFKKILIANRGEIACRIIRTAKEMGIATAAIYSEIDRNALHVRMADEAHCVGPSPPRDSYLHIGNILEVAEACQAEAIHPGYGFLSENPEFAEACLKAGRVFIGPPAEVIHQMGIKSVAKQLMTKAGVPVIPGAACTTQDSTTLRREADKLGYPLLIKADRGGGGKGIRLVTCQEEFLAALTSVQRESGSSFGDSTVLLEKYFASSRHIEVQIFRDTQGNAVHLFERDCSLQRRHQKIIEEAPASGLTADLQKNLHNTALQAIQAIGYIGAGTVEFLLADNLKYYFMEINTRLQVEHPVTEMITGHDLVAWQLLVAAGEALPCTQEEIRSEGHAVEARIYAENPFSNFLPSIGKIALFNHPAPDRKLRIETGIEAGDLISTHYDPMIAKMVIWERSRKRALTLLQKSLQNTKIAGVITNISFLDNLCLEVLHSAPLNNTFVDRHLTDLTRQQHPPETALVFACLFRIDKLKNKSKKAASSSADPYSPWNKISGYRLNAEPFYPISLWIREKELTIPTRFDNDGRYHFNLPKLSVVVENITIQKNRISAHLNGKKMSAEGVILKNSLILFHLGSTLHFSLKDEEHGVVIEDASATSFLSPMPGQIIEIHVKHGIAVNQGDAILTLEAMKMEYTISAPADGMVTHYFFTKGDSVQEGVKLLEFNAIASP